MYKLFTIRLILLALSGLLVGSCIGTDIVDDFVEQRIAIANKIQVMLVDDLYQFEALYFDNTGVNTPATFNWASSNQEVLQIDESGTATALTSGITTITVSANEAMESFEVEVFDPAEVDEDSIRMVQAMDGDRVAELKTVSSYQLEGTAILRVDNGLQLLLSNDFETTDALPGLYLYLTNNTASIANAFEVGEVTSASGSQQYQLPPEVRLNDYRHILFYCKPFRVPVGEGEFMP